MAAKTAAPVQVAPPPAPVAGGRQTTPAGFNPYAKGGAGIIPRRSMGHFDRGRIVEHDNLRKFYTDSPLRLIYDLFDTHPILGREMWNILRLACSPEDIRIVAIKESGPGEGDDRMDDAGTALLDDLWESQPAESGGFHGLLITNMLNACAAGMACMEAVPAAAGGGVARVYPVDPLSIEFDRPSKDADLIPLQRQQGGSYAARPGYQELNRATFFWRALDAYADNPYGRSPFAKALAEVLADMQLYQWIRDAVRHAAWPRRHIGINFDHLFKLAGEKLRISDPNAASEFVAKELANVRAQMAGMKPDDDIIHDNNGKIELVNGGAFQFEPILEALRLRVVQACNSLPTLLGINDGSTQTYTSVEWAIYAKGLETLRMVAADPLLRVANLHLRLLGLPLTAKLEVQAIRSNDEKADADTLSIRIANTQSLVDAGYITREQASIELTGSGPAGEPREPEEDEEDDDLPNDDRDDETDDQDVPRNLSLPRDADGKRIPFSKLTGETREEFTERYARQIQERKAARLAAERATMEEKGE
jgi:hypothetical protein